MESVQVLISCMYEDPRDIITRSNLQSDAMIINQCDHDSTEQLFFVNKQGKKCQVLVINSTERGLSKSRNMAIRNATSDICLICDDDEVFVDNYVELIQSSFASHPNHSVLAFKFSLSDNYYMKKTFWKEEKEVDYKIALKISSWQIAFKTKEVKKNKIWFDEQIGSGVTKAGGEEKIFLHECLKHHLRIIYIPQTLGSIFYVASQWTQNLFSKAYFEDWGYYFKRLKWCKLGATFMGLFFAIKKYPNYKSKLSFIEVLYSMNKGIWKK